jgi:hypothetical protein
MSSLAKDFLTEINIVKAEKIKAKVYVNQDKSLSDLQTMIKHSFKHSLIIHKLIGKSCQP